ncbi:Ig-like domain-containing protein [Trabulsiella odontotermitis]|uniref:BapA/Bap/LapF family large adhesin n=1 Tax=Trabulsiella odontotermitis TaxID=379893 RepID=UPI0024B64D7A|nr:BapA/Bap/LapF family large adhesin [Trabulsiella odontotermitis]WHP32497.1 Ig-like domain-containing protein [Trabulsiella odontotermitis]
MRPVSIISKVTGVSQQVESSVITLNSSSIVKLQLERSDIASIARSNQDMIITLHSGETITIRNFYASSELGGSQLVLEDSQGALWWVEDPDTALQFEHIDDINALLVTESGSEAGGALWPWALGGIAVAGGIAAAASTGGSGGSSEDNGSDNGGDGAGSGDSNDTTPPGAPTNMNISSEGTTVTGNAEPGSMVIIKNAEGTVLGSGRADSNGNFAIELSKPHVSGEQLTATATDDAGNDGPSANINAPNIPFPQTPVIDGAQDDVPAQTGELTQNQFTNDARPALYGTATALSVVHIYDNGTEIGSVRADADGSWNFTPSAPLSDGNHAFTVIATNVKGESQPSGSFTLNVDTDVPDAPAMTALMDDAGPDAGAIAADAITDDSTPTLSGTAEAGNIITIYDNGQPIGSVTVDNQGNWSFTPGTPMVDGTHQFGVSQTDKAGNTSPVTQGDTFYVYTTAPVAPTMNAVVDNAGNVTGALTDNQPTDDNTPTFSGTSQPGVTVQIYDNGNAIGSVVADSEGDWSFTPQPPLAEGNHEITVTAINPLGESDPTDAFTLIVDTFAPDAPAGFTVTDNVPDTVGPLQNGQTTNDTTPTLAGTTEANAIIKVYDNSVLVGQTTADTQGNWSFTPSSGLSQGSHSLTVIATDVSGNASPPSGAFVVVIDTTPPQIPTITRVTDDMPGVLGTVANNGLTNDNTPMISGSGEPGSVVKLYDGDTLLTSITVGTSGTWSYQVTTPLDDGEHSFTVTASDSNGNTTAPSSGFTVTIDTGAPATPAIDTVKDDAGTTLTDAQLTDETQPQLSGTGVAGSTITVYDNGDSLGTAIVDDDGAWTFTPETPLGDGSHTLTATATDPAGNESGEASFTLTVDGTAPDAPLIDSVTIVVGGNGMALDSGGATNDQRPTLSGEGEVDSVITIYNNGNEIGSTTVGSNGQWTFQPATDLPEGNNVLTATATDPAGNTGELSGSYTVVVDLTAPDKPAVPTITDNAAPGTGIVGNNGATNDTTPTISGTGDAGNLITIYNGNTPIGSTQVDSNGNWSFTPSPALPEASYTLTVKEADPAGNTSVASDPITFTIDTTPPAAPVISDADDNVGTPATITSGGTTDDGTPTINGTGVDGSIVTLYNGTTVIGEATVTNGEWSITTTTPLQDGTWTLTAVARDPAGNNSPVSGDFTLTVNTVPLTAPVLTDVIDNLDPQTGSLADGASTNDNTLTFNGTGKPGSTVLIYDTDTTTPFDSVTVNQDGSWTWSPVLSEGEHTFSFGAEDNAGNTLPPTNSITLTVDTLPPPPPTVVNVDANGTLISGTAEIGSTVIITDSTGTELGRGLTDTNGEFRVTINPAQLNGEALNAVAQDKAGNEGPSTGFNATNTPGAVQPPTLDVVTDDVNPNSGPLGNGDSTNDTLPTLSGEALPGAIVTIWLDGARLDSVTADSNGDWQYQLTAPLDDGPHRFAVSQTNSGSSPDFTITVDTAVPGVPVLNAIIDDQLPVTGAIASGGTTNDTRPTLSGTAEPGSVLTINDNGTAIGSITVGPGGNWVFTPTTPLGDGPHNITLVATDSAGNVGAPSTGFNFNVDTAVPATPALPTVTDDTGTTPVALTTGDPTRDTVPTLSGTTDANATVQIYDNGTLIGTATADNNGNWSYSGTTFADGSHPITIKVTDPAGNTSATSPTFTLVVDTTAPVAPTITSVVDDRPGVTGPLTSGQVTNDTQPALSGRGEAGATLTILDGSTVLGSVTVQPDGSWTFTPLTPLASGNHSFTVTATDTAGNTSAPSSAFTVVVDITPPAVPVITGVTDNTTPHTGAIADGGTTNDTRPVLNGTGDVGSVITLYSDGVVLGSTTVGSDGNWTFRPPTALTNGSHDFTLTATDAAGNTSGTSADWTVRVDTIAPAAPVISSIVDNTGSVTGPVTGTQPTNDTTPTLNGTAEANATVTIFDGGTQMGQVQADANGNWTFTPGTALGEGNHAFTVSATDIAGNTSAPSAITTIAIDTTGPAAPVVLAVNDTGTQVTGTAEAGSTVTITAADGTVLGTATADGTGAFTATLIPAQTNSETLSATATDRAGNTGTSTSFTAPSTGIPAMPVISSVLDDVAPVAGSVAKGQSTNDTLPELHGTAQAGVVVTLYDNGALLGSTTADAQGNWSFTPSTALDNGVHSFTATAANVNGTSAPSQAFGINVDTVLPDAPTATVSTDGSAISGTAEANSTVTVTLPGGATLTATADGSGNWTATLPTRQIDGESLTVTATDGAGNVSPPYTATAPDLPLAANDNVVNLPLVTDAEVTTQHYDDYGVLLVGALGNVASVLGNDTAQVEFTIADGGSGNVIINAAGTGVVLSLLSSMEILVQVYDTNLQMWTTYADSTDPRFLNLLTLGASGVTLNLEGLPGGSYRVLSYNTDLLATGSYTSLDVTVDQTSAGTITGGTSETGNVISDIDPNSGQDNAPTGTVVTSITDASGTTITVPSGGIDVQGNYGTLHINQDGSYTYTLTDTSATVLGRTESFTYTISQNGSNASANLVVTLGAGATASSVTAADDSTSLVFDTDVSAVNNGASSQGGFTVVGVNLGNVLNANVLDDLSNPIIFDVEEGSTRTMTLQSSVGGVALASSFDLYIYRFNDATQQYEQYRVVDNWLNAPLLGGQSDPLTLTLPGGQYLFLLNTASGISVLTGYTLDVIADHTYNVDSVSATTSGNVLTNDAHSGGATVTEVNGHLVSATGSTTLDGLYGTLTIDAAGNYTYTLKSGVGADSIKTPDSFVYKITGANGDTSTATLNITPTPHGVDAVNDTSSVMAVTTLQDTSQPFTDSSVGTVTWTSSLLNPTTATGNGTIDITAGSAVKDVILHFQIASALALGGLTVNWTIKDGSTIVASGNFSGGSLLGGAIDVTVPGLELHSGSYTLTYTGNVGALSIGSITITPSVRGTTIDLDNFESAGTNTVTGNIFDGSGSTGAADQLASVHTLLTVNGAGGSTATLNPLTSSNAEATINGLYGRLTVGVDGHYTYTLNNGVAISTITQKETFTYTLNDQNGHTDSATLTIDMNPQTVSTAQADRVVGSVYGDTLIYHLLSSNDATGGNGTTDSWSNFSLTQGDKIDIGDLLVGWNGQNSSLGNYLTVSASGNNTVISIDRDGTGSTYHATNLVTLENVHTTLDELIQQNHIVT